MEERCAMLSQEKQKKLAYVARRYYLEDQRQSDIAKELGVSRPLISRMLSEARELGVVEITIHEPGARMENLLERLRSFCAIQNGVLVEDGMDEDETNCALSQGAVELLQTIGARRLGVGWGLSHRSACDMVGVQSAAEQLHHRHLPAGWKRQYSRPELSVQRECPPDGAATWRSPALSLFARSAG